VSLHDSFFLEAKKKKKKAHLMAWGFSQELGIDYHESFILVIKLTSLLILFSFIVALNFKIHQMDVHITFWNGIFQEEIFM
jgi:hypothetical protein